MIRARKHPYIALHIAVQLSDSTTVGSQGYLVFRFLTKFSAPGPVGSVS